MKIGQGGCRRTPWWCWGVAFLAAIVVVPDAAIHTSADEGSGDPKPAISPWLAVHDAPADPQFEAHTTLPNQKYVVSYFVADVLSKIREERGLSQSKAEEFLAARLKGMTGAPTRDNEKNTDLDRIIWSKNSLVVGATQTGHEQVGEMLGALRKFGTAEIALEVRFAAIHNEEHLSDWTMSPSDVDEAAPANPDAVRPASFDHPLGNHEGTGVARAQLLVEKDLPVRFRIMDNEQGEEWMRHCQRDVRSNVLQTPKVTVFNGQTAFVSDISRSPFVVGLISVSPESLQPQIRHVSEGTMLQLRPVAERSGAIHLDFAATFSKIQNVETVSFNRTPAGGTTVQIPEVATARIEGGAVLKPGQWLLLGGSKPKDQAAKATAAPISWNDWLLGGGKHQEQRETQELVLILRAEKVDMPRPQEIK